MTTLRGVHKQQKASADAPAAPLLEATVLDPPLNEDGWLRVEVDGQQGVARECPWIPRLDIEPMPGDAASVIESDEGNWWAVCWWPQSGQDPHPPAGGAAWLSGDGVPAAGIGEVGDFYLNTVAHAYYGPKDEGGWGVAVPLVGPQGVQGIQGVKGDLGNPGPVGPQGGVGPQGAKGDPGVAGPVGPQGVAGPQGVEGPQGEDGPQGPIGATGVDGADGNSFIWRGTWTAGGTYFVDDVVEYGGTSYIAIAASSGQAPPAAAYWDEMVIAGPAGPQGPQGIQGPAGAQGAQGVQGPQGAQTFDASPIGSVITHTSQTIPPEYLLANGQQVNAADYPQLDVFAAAEVAAGNPRWARPVVGGVQKITLPNLSDRFIFGPGGKAFGSQGGAETHLLTGAESGTNTNGQTDNDGAHAHSIENLRAVDNATNAGGFIAMTDDGGVGGALGSGSNNGNHVHSLAGRNADAAHNNMPPYCVLAFLVKAKGVTLDGSTIEGPPGPQGIQGPQGNQGIQGPQGNVGPAGASGLSAGTRAARPAANTLPNGALYYANDNGITYQGDAVANTWTAISWVALRQVQIPVGGAFPAPEDKQRFSFVAHEANGIVWTFEYRAAASGIYKWEFVGGGALWSQEDTVRSTGSVGYVDLTNGPSLTIPLRGDYTFDLSVQANTPSGSSGLAAIKNGGAATVDADCVQVYQNNIVSAARRMTRWVQNNNEVVKVQYRSSGGGNVSFSNRGLTATPVRVG